MENGFIILTENELKELIIKSFNEGALSYENRKGQPDTCWLNIHEDAKDYASHVIKKENNNFTYT